MNVTSKCYDDKFSKKLNKDEVVTNKSFMAIVCKTSRLQLLNQNLSLFFQNIDIRGERKGEGVVLLRML